MVTICLGLWFYLCAFHCNVSDNEGKMKKMVTYAKRAVSREVLPSILLFSVSAGVVWVFARMWFEDGVVVSEEKVWIRTVELVLFSIIGLYGAYCAVRSVRRGK